MFIVHLLKVNRFSSPLLIPKPFTSCPLALHPCHDVTLRKRLDCSLAWIWTFLRDSIQVPFQSHVESAVTDTSALPFDWWEVCKARPRPFAVSQAVCHIARRVLLWSSPVHWPTLHCRSRQRRENTRRLPVRSDCGVYISVWNIQRLVQGAVRIANGYLVILFLHGLARELAFD